MNSRRDGQDGSGDRSSRWIPGARLADGAMEGSWWRPAEEDQGGLDGTILCTLCPRQCMLKPGDRGFCFVRENRDGRMVLSTFGRSTGLCIDPIEKKPLFHFYPGTSVLSLGTAGCNLGCKFCQNWDISKSRQVERLSAKAEPDQIVAAALEHRCRSVAFTYNDPVVWAEYAIATARACRQAGVAAVAVTAGYIQPEARGPFFEAMDATNIDLKGFTESFYWKTTSAHLQPVLDTIRYVHRETDCWMELTNLMIPGVNDSPDDFRRMCEWILGNVGDRVPLHLTAFHPDFRMMDRPPTPLETLLEAHQIAIGCGLKYIYIGNVANDHQSTRCPHCGHPVVLRHGYTIDAYHLTDGNCSACGGTIAGRWGAAVGRWGARRQPIFIANQISSPQGLHGMQPSNPSVTLPEWTIDQWRVIHRQAARWLALSAMQQTLPSEPASEELTELAGVELEGCFVSVRRGKLLRGCCGSLGRGRLEDQLRTCSYRTACEDHRMASLSPIELQYLDLEVTVLGPCEPLLGGADQWPSQIVLGTHGLRLRYRDHQGVLLVSVPIEQGWNVEQFLGGLCRKAGLQERAWKELPVTIERFEGRVHGAPLIDALPELPKTARRGTIHPDQVKNLRALVGSNMLAIAQGATPSYTAPDLPDGTVQGLVLSLWEEGAASAMAHLIRLSLRPGVPLQSTLFELAKTASQILQQARPGRHLQVQVELAVLTDPVPIGGTLANERWAGRTPSVADLEESGLDWRGHDPGRRAIVAMQGGERVSVTWDAFSTPDALIDQGLQHLTRRAAPVTIYSMAVVATKPQGIATSAAGAQMGPGIRPPAVAGSFYPATDEERWHGEAPWIVQAPAERQSVLAAMVPHAGWGYCGKIVSELFSSIEFPKSVLLIGPKHTREGVDWAVSPHRAWEIPDSTPMEVDLPLTEQIATHVTGMQLDVAAHRREHGIEVLLPMLKRWSPSSRIAAMVLADGSWSEIQRAAVELAEVIRRQATRPLLVVSSDLNHYAADAENRRRDAMALEAIQTGDPEQLLAVCREQRISMCGVIPAALVMETLRQLGCDARWHLQRYATSADAGGDPRRVVGYAGGYWLNASNPPQVQEARSS